MESKAVVIGAGIAGLAAACVLSRRYSTVTVLDRDALPVVVEPRRGAPQGTQVHVLLSSGLNELNKLFPDFEKEVVAAGAVKFDLGTGLAVHRYGRRSRAIHTGLSLVSASRSLVEAILRRRVVELAGVAIRDRVAVSGLAASEGAVTGVVLDTGETVSADLVVDCSGRGTRSDRWLSDLGYRPPEQLEIRARVGYATRTYRRLPGDLADWEAVLTLPTPPHQKVGGVIMPVEGDRWMVGLEGWHTDPPTDAEQFELFAKGLPDTLISEVMSRAEPLSDVTTFRFPSSRRRLFEKLDRLPAGYVALGDALCSFNPIYGQGMTCAVQEAAALGKVLDEQPSASVVRAYYAAAAAIVSTPWQFSVGGDFNYPETTGPRPRDVKLRNWYARQVEYAAQMDPGVNEIFWSVQQLVTSPDVLLRPGLAMRVLWLAGKRQGGGNGGRANV